LRPFSSRETSSTSHIPDQTGSLFLCSGSYSFTLPRVVKQFKVTGGFYVENIKVTSNSAQRFVKLKGEKK